MKRCPTCKQPISASPGRVCSECSFPILRHHKFYFVESRVRHRNCADPTSYGTEPAAVAQAQLLEGA